MKPCLPNPLFISSGPPSPVNAIIVFVSLPPSWKPCLLYLGINTMTRFANEPPPIYHLLRRPGSLVCNNKINQLSCDAPPCFLCVVSRSLRSVFLFIMESGDKLGLREFPSLRWCPRGYFDRNRSPEPPTPSQIISCPFFVEMIVLLGIKSISLARSIVNLTCHSWEIKCFCSLKVALKTLLGCLNGWILDQNIYLLNLIL